MELLEANDEVRKRIMARASTSELRQAALANGMVPLYEDALRHACEGHTSLDEVLRVVANDVEEDELKAA